MIHRTQTRSVACWRRFVACCASLAVLAAPALAQEQGPLTCPGSLFDKQSGDGLIFTRTAIHKGDLLTIVVSEQQTGTTSASTNSSKKDSTTMNSSVLQSLTNMFGGSIGSILKSPFSTTGSGVNSATAGAGSTSTSTSFTANITVTVKEVQPNGNLVLEGRRTITMNKHPQTILLEGIARRDDVSLNNTVLSQNVADLRLVAEGKGLIANRQREGILTKLISWIF